MVVEIRGETESSSLLISQATAGGGVAGGDGEFSSRSSGEGKAVSRSVKRTCFGLLYLLRCFLG